MSGAGEYQPRTIMRLYRLEYLLAFYLDLSIPCPTAKLDGTNQDEDKRSEIEEEILEAGGEDRNIVTITDYRGDIQVKRLTDCCRHFTCNEQ